MFGLSDWYLHRVVASTIRAAAGTSATNHSASNVPRVRVTIATVDIPRKTPTNVQRVVVPVWSGSTSAKTHAPRGGAAWSAAATTLRRATATRNHPVSPARVVMTSRLAVTSAAGCRNANAVIVHSSTASAIGCTSSNLGSIALSHDALSSSTEGERLRVDVVRRASHENRLVGRWSSAPYPQAWQVPTSSWRMRPQLGHRSAVAGSRALRHPSTSLLSDSARSTSARALASSFARASRALRSRMD